MVKQIFALSCLLAVVVGCSDSSDAPGTKASQSTGGLNTSGDVSSLSDEQLQARYQSDLQAIDRSNPTSVGQAFMAIGQLPSYREIQRRSDLAEKKNLAAAAEEEAARNKQYEIENARSERKIALDQARDEKAAADAYEAGQKETAEAAASDNRVLDEGIAEERRQEKARAEQQPHS